MAGQGPTVIIIGAGIIGASAAYALQSAGAQVRVLDAGGETATASSFGWINASFHHDAAHYRLREEGIVAWRRLSARLSLPITWQGTLCWEETGAAFDVQRDKLDALGYALREIDRETFAALEPNVAQPPERALHFTSEAAVDSSLAVTRLMNAAVELGAQRLRGLRVEGFVEDGGQIAGIKSQAGIILADQVLIAAGTGSEALMAKAGTPMPMLHRPALVLRTRPTAHILHHVLVSELGELRQLPDGSLLMPAAANHQGDTSDTLPENLDATAQDAMNRLRSLIPEVPLELQEMALAFRPVPQDGLPVIGAVREGLHVACMHSGITLGALAGELVAQEMLEGVSNRSGALLAPYRPAR